jgi:hypothetical protein
MMRARWFLAACAACCGLAAHAAPAPFAAVSIRQYQEQGPSYLRLFLYSLNGKLLRELPEKPGLDDEQPAISSDGRTLLFFRHAADAAHRDAEQFVTYNIASGRETPIASGAVQAEQQRYTPTLRVTEFSWDYEKLFQPDANDGEEAEMFASADSAFQVVRRPNPGYSDASTNDELPFNYFIKAKGSAQMQDLATLSGYKPGGDLWNFLVLDSSPFFRERGFDALFMEQHINSTAGDAIWLLDLKTRRWTQMSQNGGHLYVTEGQPGITLIRESRYENLGKTGQSVNCGYLELWSPHLKPIDLGPPVSLFHSAAIFYGEGKTAIFGDPQYGS